MQVCNFDVAVNEGFGEKQRVTYFRVSAWDKQAVNCAKFLAKGRKVCVVGSVSAHAYQANNGTLNAQLDLSAHEVHFLSARDDAGATAQAPAPADPASDVAPGFTPVQTEDLPF